MLLMTRLTSSRDFDVSMGSLMRIGPKDWLVREDSVGAEKLEWVSLWRISG